MVGNAVPVDFAKVLAKQIKSDLQQKNSKTLIKKESKNLVLT